jgi:hypothetical protein
MPLIDLSRLLKYFWLRIDKKKLKHDFSTTIVVGIRVALNKVFSKKLFSEKSEVTCPKCN